MNKEVNIFEEQYINKKLNAQRLYPNEGLLCFLGGRGLLGKNNKDIRVLEVGCGSGANLWMLAKEGFDVYGMDASETGLRLAKEHLNHKWGVDANLHVGTFDNLPYENEFFDIVVDVVSMQHIELSICRKALKEINRVLKPNGTFYSFRLSDHSAMYFNSGADKLDCATVKNMSNEDLPLSNNGKTSFWSPSLVLQEYSMADLKVESVERCTRTYSGALYSVEYLSIIARK